MSKAGFDLHQALELLRSIGGRDTVFFVVALDVDTGCRQWLATAGGPWNRELRQAAAEYERYAPGDCGELPMPDPAERSNN